MNDTIPTVWIQIYCNNHVIASKKAVMVMTGLSGTSALETWMLCWKKKSLHYGKMVSWSGLQVVQLSHKKRFMIWAEVETVEGRPWDFSNKMTSKFYFIQLTKLSNSADWTLEKLQSKLLVDYSSKTLWSFLQTIPSLRYWLCFTISLKFVCTLFGHILLRTFSILHLEKCE